MIRKLTIILEFISNASSPAQEQVKTVLHVKQPSKKNNKVTEGEGITLVKLTISYCHILRSLDQQKFQ